MAAYLVCFDLGASIEEQTKQVNYWLSFLYSSLPLPTSPTAQKDKKWIIFLVGLKSDLRKPGAIAFRQNHLNSWKKNWHRLPIFDQVFSVSSVTSIQSVHDLFNIVGKECDRIFQSHSVLIPNSYRLILKFLESIPSEKCFVNEEELLTKYSLKMHPHSFHSALEYLHAIGRIVLFSNGLVCTNAAIAPKIAAKFVSPPEIRLQLLKKETEAVQILDKEEIGCLLQIETNER